MMTYMGFGYKTTWLAVRDRSTQDVVDALRLTDRERLSWDVGVERAYKSGVYVGFIGDVTPAEHELGKGTRTWDGDWRNRQEDDWDAWYATAPGEQDVLHIAAR
jgi:hypothetical protein